jgi:hypothetical protein
VETSPPSPVAGAPNPGEALKDGGTPAP